MFKLDPTVAQRALEKFERVLDTRSQAAVDASLASSPRRGQGRREPDALLVDCCHAYATVGEIVARLKKEWGEFQEPVGL